MMIGTIRKTQSPSPLSYIEFGAGEKTLLFLHGWGGSALSFQDLWAAIGKETLSKYRVLALDFPGFGNSPKPPTPWHVADYAELVKAFCDEMGINTAYIVCHSFGGRVTTVLASTYPEGIEQIAYIAPAGIRHKSKKREAIQKVAGLAKKTSQWPLVKHVFPLAQKTVHIALKTDYGNTSGIMRETFQNVIEEDLRDFFPKITAQTHIFWGKHDDYVPYTDSAIMKAAIPNSTVTLFEDGRHGIHKTHAKDIASKLAL